MSLLITRSLKCDKTPHQELPRGKVLKEFPLTMVGISREEDLGQTCSRFFFQFLEHYGGIGGVFFVENWWWEVEMRWMGGVVFLAGDAKFFHF